MKKAVRVVTIVLGCMVVVEFVRQEIIYWRWDTTCNDIAKRVYEKLH